MEGDFSVNELCELKINDDMENSDGSSDSMVFVAPPSISNRCNTWEKKLEKKDEETLETIRQKYDTESLEKKDLLEKSILLEERVTQLVKEVEDDNYFRSNIVNYVNTMERIIYEDETRYELFEQSHEPSIYNFEQHSLSISNENIVTILDKLKDFVVRKFNKYYNELRDMDNRIINLHSEKVNLKKLIEEKELIIKNSSKYKRKEINVDAGDQLQSLREAEKVNKRNTTEITLLKTELENLESDNGEFQRVIRTLKKDLRTKKTENEELHENLNDLQTEKELLEKENKKLKRTHKEKSHNSLEQAEEMSKLQRKITKYKEKSDSKNKQIETLENEINEKNEKLSTLEMSMNDFQSSLKTRECAQKELTELEKTLKKKEEALNIIRIRFDAEVSEKKVYQDKSILLEEKVGQLEKDVEMKLSAIEKMKGKLKIMPSMESELQSMKQIQMKLGSKEMDIKVLTKALDEMKQKFEDKTRDFELMKKEKIGLEKEIQNMKLLTFKHPDRQN